MSRGDSVRLFTALWPDPGVRSRLAALRDAWRWPAAARPVADAKLHATLHFIGAFPRQRLTELGAALAPIAVRPLRLGPAGTDVFRGGIAVVLLEAEPALLDLHRRLGAALAGLGLAVEERPYRPHVTLARKAAGAHPPAALAPLDWQADRFALVLSRGGSYEVLLKLGGAVIGPS